MMKTNKLLILVAFVSLLFVGANADCDVEVQTAEKEPTKGKLELIVEQQQSGIYGNYIRIYRLTDLVNGNIRYIVSDAKHDNSVGISQ